MRNPLRRGRQRKQRREPKPTPMTTNRFTEMTRNYREQDDLNNTEHFYTNIYIRMLKNIFPLCSKHKVL